MSKRQDQIEQFISDKSFYNWVHKLNEQDVERWEATFAQDPDLRKVAEEAIQLMQGIRFEKPLLPSPQIVQSWDKLEKALVDNPPHKQGRTFFFKRSVRAYVGIAASLIMLFGLGIWKYWNTPPRPTAITFTTSSTEIKEIMLPDSSFISLNANSSISYNPQQWEREQVRTIILVGEAFFEVREKKNRLPFHVITEALTVKVLGTSFNVKGLEGTTEVVLNTGSVLLQSNTEVADTLNMNPGDYAKYSLAKRIYEEKKVNPLVHYAWKDHRVVFDQTPLEEVAQFIRASFEVEVVIGEPELEYKTISGDIHNVSLEKPDSSLARMLEIINGYYEELTINREGDTVFIRKNPLPQLE